jgi:hypothetical protein
MASESPPASVSIPVSPLVPVSWLEEVSSPEELVSSPGALESSLGPIPDSSVLSGPPSGPGMALLSPTSEQPTQRALAPARLKRRAIPRNDFALIDAS